MIGGALGAGARYLVGRWLLVLMGPGYPWGTLAVNLLGGLAMGVLIGVLARISAGESVRLFLAVGLLGGFTTFSAFSLDIVAMIERGAAVAAIGYALMSVIGAVVALFAGMAAVRGLA
ncbi:MAG: camphor resistance protein CrcB [Sphingomonas sp. 28-63-12]|nr:MAG: camphor resistance protein CrcB [Sphingomonas sp. 28-63-12]